MAKKANKQIKKKKTPKSLPWKKWLQKGLIASVFVAVFGAAFSVYSHIQKVEHDLSVIGNGKATVVQIHDPNCQLCRRLKSNLDGVKGDFSEDVQFKTANIASTKGRTFAQKHQVPHVTLLFFDKSGQRVNTLQGVSPKEEIRTALEKLTKRRS